MSGLSMFCKLDKEEFIGKEALAAQKANGVEKLCDDIAADNPSIALFKEMGFSEEWRNDDAVMMAKTL